MIPVTKPYMPNLQVYQTLLDGIWRREWLTNHGPLVAELEDKLKKFSECEHAFFVGNGTVALQISLKALGVQGEVITTPFSYVATTSSIVWEGCTPVFADIDPLTWNISPTSIREKITAQTAAILATHVYGNPCHIDAIQEIADEYQLKVIYDAAHGFGTKYKEKSLYAYGDISTASFHATKLFHTVEGGALFCNDDETAHRIGYMRNFGHHGQEAFWGLGINGKNSELHAAMGLAIWPDIDKLIEKRKQNYALYEAGLAELIEKEIIKFPQHIEGSEPNRAYVPILLLSEKHLLRLRDILHAAYIYPRRYFYPALHTLPYVSGDCPVAEDYACRVLCLPTYDALTQADIERMVNIIVDYLKFA